MKKKLFNCAVNQFVRKIIKKPNEETITIQKSSKWFILNARPPLNKAKPVYALSWNPYTPYYLIMVHLLGVGRAWAWVLLFSVFLFLFFFFSLFVFSYGSSQTVLHQHSYRQFAFLGFFQKKIGYYCTLCMMVLYCSVN